MKHHLSRYLSLFALLFASAAIQFLSAFEPVTVEAVPSAPTRLPVEAEKVTDAIALASANPARMSGAAIHGYLASIG